MALSYIDTHSHLYATDFEEDVDDVLNSCKTNGVDIILLPAIDRSSFESMTQLVENHPKQVIPMMGLHPCSVKPETYMDELAFVRDELNNGKYIAVGEIGMDLYWDKSTQEIQEEAFVQQCEWAIELDLPIAIHSRNATNEVIKLIKEINNPKLTGVFHCFGDGISEANEIIDLGFKLGIGGVLTFKNSGLDKVISEVDLKHVILETDSPYLAPSPYRGKRNESSYIPLIAEKLADVKRVPVTEVAEITTRNAKELFRI